MAASSSSGDYLVGHVTKRTDKGGIFVETPVNGEKREAWFGEKIVKTNERGEKFIPEGAAAKKIEYKARVILPAYDEEPKQVEEHEEQTKKNGGKIALMKKCIRAAKVVVDDELCCDLALEPVEFAKLRVDATLRIASSFYIDETKNARMDRIR